MSFSPTFVENTNEYLDICINLNLDQFINLLENTNPNPDIKDNDIEGKAITTYSKLIELKKYKDKHGGKIPTTYKFGKGLKSGRQYAQNPSLQMLRSDVRGLISYGIYKDYDMVNAQPTLLLYLCKKYGVHAKNLEKYIRDRNERLEEFMVVENCDRKTAKNYFIKSIMSQWKRLHFEEGKIRRKIKNKFFIEFDEEIKYIQKIFYDDKFKNRRHEFPVKNPNNKVGSFISHILSELESKVLEKVISKYSCEVKMFDGFYSTQDIPIEDLDEITRDYGIKWNQKELDLSLLHLMHGVIPEKKMSIYGSDLNDLAHKLLSTHLKEKVIFCQGNYYFKDDLKYIVDDKLTEKYLFKFLANSCIYIDGEKSIPIHTSINDIKNLSEFILKMSSEDYEFKNRIWDNTKSKIYFVNGYLDFIKNEFIENDTERLTFGYTNREFSTIRNTELEKEIYDRIFNPIFTIRNENDKIRIQLRDAFIYRLKRMLGGFIEDKIWNTMEGERNSGKGVISDMLLNAFGSYYIKTTNAENFVFKNSMGDEAKANSFLCNFEFSKIVLTQEVSNDKQIDGNKIKKFSSGGDTFEARQNYHNEKNFKLQSSLIMCCNDIPPTNPTDAKETVEQYSLRSKFIKPNEDQKYSTISYYPRDDTIKNDFIKRDDVLNEFINIIFNAPYVQYPEELKKEIIEDEINDDDKFIRLFEFTKNSEDRIENEVLRGYIKHSKIKFTLHKCKKLLKGKGAIEYRDSKNRGLNGLIYIG